ncbi:hypothetical protein V2J09_003561 [Rumex salicifolius]
MAATGATLLAGAASFSIGNRRARIFTAWPKLTISPADRASTSASASSSPAAVTSSPAASGSLNGSLRISPEGSNGSVPRRESKDTDGGEDELKDSAADYFEQAKALIRPDGGPPRWFSPPECRGSGERLENAPLLLYLPGIDGVGLGLTRQHKRLAKMFDVWCLHIPVMDRTSFADLVKLIENRIIMEHTESPSRPIYLVGESLGACLAMVIAARNPKIDLVLILSNPATSFKKSQLQGLTPLLGFMPTDPLLSVPYLLSLLRGRTLLEPQAFEDLLRDLLAFSANSSVIADILPRETLLWKMELLELAASHANSRLHAIKAETLILSSGMDPLLPSQEEGQRLQNLLPNCEIRKFSDNGHFLFLEDGVDVVTTIKAANFYRRRRNRDLVADYVQPTSSEFSKICEQYSWYDIATSPVMYSTLENGQIVRGLSGMPTEGPVIYVGYHMLMGFELYPFVSRVYDEKNILVRGLAHPMMFTKPGELKDLDSSMFDTFRFMGAVPVSGTNMFKLLSSKSHVLLYPGGVREALHRKGEEYQLFWPEQAEFVRMAARFGAKIVPFGAVGEDDISELVFDYNDYMSIPYFKNLLQDTTNKLGKLRTDMTGEVANQEVYLPGIVPKLPGRIYYLMGKPIDTQGRKEELKDRDKAQELYLEVKSEVQTCLEYLRANRQRDPYRSILSRTLYQATNGFTSQVPSFDP